MAHFFTADTHFGHAGVLTMSRRPFGAGEIALHDRMLIEAWNARVGPDDHVWHLGDFAYAPKPNRIRAIFEQLAGQLHLVRGNHDYAETVGLPWCEPPRDLVETSLEGTRLVMAHYPMRAWRGAFKGALHLYGHMHGRYAPTSQSLDVGVDCWSYAPTSLPEIRARLAAHADVTPEEHAAGRAAED